MATIKVKFRSSMTPDREGTIFYQVIHERKPRQVLTEYKVFPYEWNEYRATVTCSQQSPRCPYILSVRERIKVDVERLLRIVRTFERERPEYTSDDIVEEYERLSEENSLFRFMNQIIAKLKFNGKVRTSETYKSALNSFRNYREGEDIMLESINKEIMEAYEAWLRQRGVSSNTISFYTRILRAVYNRAVDEELTENRNPFKRVFTGIEKTVKRALPMKIIKKIKSLDLSLYPQLDFARDMFLLSFMLRGMSLIDMAFLKKSDLNNGHVTYRRRKTGQILTIQWTPEMQGIIDKYPYNETSYLLPIIRNPHAVPLYAYRNMGYYINRQLRKIAEQLELPIPLTMYVARHSWASAAKARGIPISIISEGMGHDSELTTQIYLASLDTSVVDKANSLLIKDLNSN
ncbi:MAG: site-specific integrase [Muribaculaceae bacterium]|nr:site-specific integrase [Muribaculaceae bacterium]